MRSKRQGIDYDESDLTVSSPGDDAAGPTGVGENGAKAVAEEATKDRATPAFFAEHSIATGAGQHRQAGGRPAAGARALEPTRMTVQISTKINRSHLGCGETALASTGG